MWAPIIPFSGLLVPKGQSFTRLNSQPQLFVRGEKAANPEAQAVVLLVDISDRRIGWMVKATWQHGFVRDCHSLQQIYSIPARGTGGKSRRLQTILLQLPPMAGRIKD